jgi:hypothetical protein
VLRQAQHERGFLEATSAKLQHWRGFQSINAPEAAPMLEFGIRFTAVLHSFHFSVNFRLALF